MRCKKSYLGNRKHFMLLNDSILTFYQALLPTYLQNTSLECASELDREAHLKEPHFSVGFHSSIHSLDFICVYKAVQNSHGLSGFFSFPSFMVFFSFLFWTTILNEMWVMSRELTERLDSCCSDSCGDSDSWGSFGLFFRSCQKKYLGPRLGRDAGPGSPGQRGQWGWEASICPAPGPTCS